MCLKHDSPSHYLWCDIIPIIPLAYSTKNAKWIPIHVPLVYSTKNAKLIPTLVYFTKITLHTMCLKRDLCTMCLKRDSPVHYVRCAWNVIYVRCAWIMIPLHHHLPKMRNESQSISNPKWIPMIHYPTRIISQKCEMNPNSYPTRMIPPKMRNRITYDVPETWFMYDVPKTWFTYDVPKTWSPCAWPMMCLKRDLPLHVMDWSREKSENHLS